MGLTDQTTTVKGRVIGMLVQSHELLPGVGTVEIRWISHYQGGKEQGQMIASQRGHGALHIDMVHSFHHTILIIVLFAQVPHGEGHPIWYNMAHVLFQQ